MSANEVNDLNSISMTMKEEVQEKVNSLQGDRYMDKFGKYQLMVYLIISYPLLLSAGYALNYAFTSGEVNYRCFIPECENASTSFNTSWSNHSIPPKKNIFGSCDRFGVKNDIAGSCSEVSFTNEITQCDSFVYDNNGEKTILNEWDITCNNNRWKLTLVGTINNVGQLVGLIFAGYLSDRYGRRTLLVGETVFCGILGIVQSFSVNYLMFILLEFGQSVVSAGIYSTGFILCLEMVGEKRRVLGGTITCCMYAVGEMILGLVAMIFQSWRTILQVFFIPSLFAIFLPLFIPESIRWLSANGKHEEVKKIYEKMIKMNGIKTDTLPNDLYTQLNIKNNPQELKTKSNQKVPVREALSRPKLLIRLLACCFCWLTNTFVYYGLSLNSVSFAGDKYVNFILVSFVEIPAYFLCWLLIDNLGRKYTLLGSFLFSGLFCLGIQFVPKDLWTPLPLIMFLCGKGCITMSFAAVYVYTAEMFPTTARHFLLSICSMTGRLGSILAPQTRLLATLFQSLPLILFGSMAMLAAITTLVFPETLKHPLPDTIEDAENIGKTKDIAFAES